MPFAVWSYNFITHLSAQHLDEDGHVPQLESETWMDAFVTKAEEDTMDIKTEDTEFWRLSNGIPDSDSFEWNPAETLLDVNDDEADEEVDNTTADHAPVTGPSSSKRGRSQTTTSVVSTAPQTQRMKR
jgi:hypothetical protein